MAEPMLYHRAPAFVDVYARVLRRLKDVFATQNDVLIFAASGSGALESASANLVRRGRPALVASCGKFGERWAELSDAYGGDTVHWETEWGQKIDPAELDRVLGENPDVEVVFTTLSETSTGVINDVRELGEVAHRHGALIVVDAVSGLGAVPVPQDEWNLDVVVSGSQKALMSPPGLAFASPNEAALEYAAGTDTQRFYFDWARTVAGQRKDPPDSPFTPAVGPRGRARRGARDDRGRGPRAGLRASPPARPGLPRGGPRARPGDLRARRRERQRGHGDQPARDDRRQPGAEAHARPLRHHDRRRAGPAQGPHRPARALRLLRRLRHPPHPLGLRDDAVRARTRRSSSARAWPRRSGCSSRRACPSRLRRERRSPGPRTSPGQGEDRRLGSAAAARRRARRGDRRRLVAGGAREPHRRVRRHPDPVGHQAHRRPDRQGHQPAGGRPRRRGRGQRGRGRRHQARRGGGQRAPVQRDHRGRAHDRPAAGARPAACPRPTPR